MTGHEHQWVEDRALCEVDTTEVCTMCSATRVTTPTGRVRITDPARTDREVTGL